MVAISFCWHFSKAPSAAAQILHGMSNFQAQQILCLGNICPEGRQVTIPVRADHIGELHDVSLVEGVDELQDGNTVTGL